MRRVCIATPRFPGIDAAGLLWTRAHPMTGSPFSGTYQFQGRVYKYVGSYFEMGPTAKGFLFVGGPSSITQAVWWQNFVCAFPSSP